MKTIRSLLIDDNVFNLTVLSDLLKENHPDFQIIGTAVNGQKAIEQINQLKPDLIFLDIEMPDMNGFDVLASLEHIDFQTIFVTAHSHYAIQAIRFNALDYLVKPIDPKELSSAIKRYYSNDYARQNQDQIREALNNLNKKEVQDQVLFLPTQEGGIKMTLSNIVKIEGDRNYSSFFLLDGKTKISSKTLGYFEEILEGKGFFRCHRSFIVNYHHINKMQKDAFLLKDLSTIPISRRKKTNAKAWFNKHS
ncbi:MAG: LytTR family DNA-binding domain-containing protein [Bacteroidetes bacterium]|jgi:two-component system LytT family response regulator|nr:LytTR family DNA-binding domain-containing protein [Bacteroidota bacterium]MDF1866202.1 LytTR family DNA-binding domain-containing protein [Saprospiraceae bacterium]